MYSKLRLGTVVLAAAVFMIFPGLASAAPGQLDPTFGNGGFSIPAAPADYSYSPFGVFEQTGGKLVTVASEQYFSGPVRIVVQRMNGDGSPDASFGNNGIGRFTPSSGSWALFEAAASPTTGQIAVTGYHYTGTLYEAFVVMFNGDGTVDQNFDGDASNTCAGDGVVCTHIDPAKGEDQGRALLFQSDGKLLVGGVSQDSSGYSRMAVVRYTDTGALDTGFSGDGLEQIAVGPWDSYVNSIAVSSTGDIVIAGGAEGKGLGWNGVEDYFDVLAVARLSSTGAVDSTFHQVPVSYTGGPYSDGVINTTRSFWTTGIAQGVSIAADGKVVVTGSSNDDDPSGPSKASLFVARLNTDGTYDSDFGNGGLTYLDPSDQYQGGSSLRLDPAGRALIAGDTTDAGQPTLAARFTASGALDQSFNGSGYRVFENGGIGIDPGSLLTSDGKWVLAGGSSGSLWAAARLLLADDPKPPAAGGPSGVPQPSLKIASPAKKSIKRKKFKTIAGTAGPAGGVNKVEIALQLVDKSLLKKKKKCEWLSSGKAKFKRTKAKKGRCSSPYYRAAAGTDKWNYRISKPLPAGSYKLTVRVTSTSGQTALKTYSFKLKK